MFANCFKYLFAFWMLSGILVLAIPFELLGVELICVADLDMEEDDCQEDENEKEDSKLKEYVPVWDVRPISWAQGGIWRTQNYSAYNSPTLEVQSRPPISRA